MTRSDQIQSELDRTRKFLPVITKLLNRNSHRFFKIREATKQEDTQHGFDFMLSADAAEIAVRIRRPTCRFRDFTIRSEVPFGNKTEIHKIQEGKGDMYFYAWTSKGMLREKIESYMIVDLHVFRSSGLAFSPKLSTANGDGTAFVNFTKDELDKSGCLLIYERISS